MPKTKRNRTIPISKRLSKILAAWWGSQKQQHAVWLFPSPQGKRWDPDNLSARFRKKMQRAGLPWNLLDLRHTFGSHLAKKGTSLLKISILMGNSPTIARRHYIHLIPEEMYEDVEF